MSPLELAEAARAVDGVAPFNEVTMTALADGADLRVDETTEATAALAAGDAPVEIVVDPAHRRQGHGRALVGRLLTAGETRFWAHGDLSAAQALASATGLTSDRTLLVLRTHEPLTTTPPPPEGVTIRSFREDDADAIVSVNAAAFASHPEQGAMDRADFDRRRASPWFDPAGLFVAERDGVVLGFHWTKVEDGIGEVYVVGVDPAQHGGGLGTALTAHGLAHLWNRRVRAIDLYVEGDNAPALHVYHRLGFTEIARDVLYTA